MTPKTRTLSEERRAKIICTLGPATDREGVIARLISHGMDAARLNLSFGNIDEHIRRIQVLREVMGAKPHRPVAIIADLPGRKVRIGRVAGSRIQLEPGTQIRLHVEDGTIGDKTHLPVDRGLFHENMMRGDKVLLSDGLVELLVDEIRGDGIIADVVYGGEVTERTGIHAPGMPVRGGALSAEDVRFLEMAIAYDVDYIGLSYVADASDILEVREKMLDFGRDLPIIAKIERSEAFARLDGVLKRADAVMIRRGDLGAEMEVTRIPLVQKEILRLANHRGVPVIIATQMLGSMIAAPTPTRAEASDVSNAVADGADGVLLSAETAIGAYPVEAVAMMGRIIAETERGRFSLPIAKTTGQAVPFDDVTASIACEAAVQCNAKLIACFTESGMTASLVAKYRPNVPIIAFCTRDSTRRKLALNWGIRTDNLDPSQDVELMVRKVEARLLERGLVRHGDRLVIAFGAPVGEKGHTNSVRLHEVT